ncbi:hypothetical protein [Adhaeretor mobilis]|uniref:PEP-CTERM protein-sorting domain-containing protein n=1 Tax=Adhaeretor mobilis TaxID=1930276 RepID=A0A517MYK7_9BACT|nr:hypothetical protein [Adhaeretor mobilis]QDS99972.1 hypothetical protein HG15A2_33080 [Adhaeretor mobilis]
MNQVLPSRLVLLLALLLAEQAIGSELVTMTDWGSATLQDGVYGNFSGIYNPRTTYSYDREVFDRDPLRNRIDWAFTVQTPEYQRMEWNFDAYSTFSPERTLTDRFGNTTTYPAHYDSTELTAEIPLGFNEPVYVRVSLEAAGIRGVERLSVNYFGRSFTYEASPATQELLPSTTLIPDGTTTDPLDVHNFVDWFETSEDGVINVELESAYTEDGTFLDGELRLMFDFAQAISWQGDYNFDALINGSDFLEWQLRDSNTTALQLWQTNYGILGPPSGGGPAAAMLVHQRSVPEPSQMGLLALAALQLIFPRAKRRNLFF